MKKKKIQNLVIRIVFLILIIIATINWYYRELPQQTIIFIPDVKVPTSSDRVLVFAPHPDDETIATGGYIIKSLKENASVSIVILMNGNWRSEERKRYDELLEATNTLGVKEENIYFLNYPDNSLRKQNPKKVKKEFMSIINKVEPTIILFPTTKDFHTDHKTAGKILKELIVEEKLYEKNITFYEYLVHFPNYPEPIFSLRKTSSFDKYMLPPTRLLSFDYTWNKLLLDNEEQSKKLEAVLAYKSQLSYIREPFLRALLFGMVRKNELFIVDKEINKD
ncbi:MAG: PIG-L family deacetylase [Candidatus Woesearchaeota archaeon]